MVASTYDLQGYVYIMLLLTMSIDLMYVLFFFYRTVQCSCPFAQC